MKVNFDYAFLDDRGRPVTINGQPATMKNCSVQALLHGKAEGQEGEPDGKEKRRRYDLAARIHNFGKEALLTEEDVILLKSVIGVHHTLVAAPGMDLLDGKEPVKFSLAKPEGEAPKA